jgi:hypothetical protein
MTPFRVAFRFRRLALVLCLPACHTWKPVELAPGAAFATDARVRVERTDWSRVVIIGPGVVQDSLFGWDRSTKLLAAVALADVRRADERRFSGWRTTLLVVGVVVGGFVGLVGLILASPGAPGL